METYFPLLKSLTKALRSDTSYKSPAPHQKCVLLKNINTPTEKKEYQMVSASTVMCNDKTIRPTLSRVEIHGNYDRGNKIIAMSPPTMITITLNKTKINFTTVKRILKPQI